MKIAILTTDGREMSRRYDAVRPDIASAPAALLQGFAALPGLEIHVLSCTQQPLSSPEKLADNIFFHSLHVPKIGWLRTGYQGCIRAVRRKLRELRPALVHGQGTERDCALSAVFSGFPNVLTIHGNMRKVTAFHRAPLLSFYGLAARLETFVLPRTDGVVCITTYTRQAVASLTPKTWLIPNAIDASFFDIDPRPETPPRLLCVGTIDPRKNQNALIRALDAEAKTKSFHLIFLGHADPSKPYAREFLDLVNTRDWCRYEGFAERPQLKAQFARASGLILPSLEDNCPMVVLEAMAAGVPVAAAAVGGVPDLVRNDETGWLFDPLSPAALAAAINQLLSPAAPACAALARREALLRFHPEIIARQHLQMYEEILGPLPSIPSFRQTFPFRAKS